MLASTETLRALLLTNWRRISSAHATDEQRAGAAMLRAMCEVNSRTYEWHC
jgi:hypothetical protein